MEITVTGGSGRLGRSVIDRLLRAGHTVRAIDWQLSPEVMTQYPQVRWIRLDLTELAAALEALTGSQAVIHSAAYPGPFGYPPGAVYHNNTLMSYNILAAASTLGVRWVVLASSINALGGIGSRRGQFDYFPVDELHPTYNEDDYSLSKWVMEQQADSFARRFPSMTISSLRFHALPDDPPILKDGLDPVEAPSARTLWGWTLMSEAARACEQAAAAGFNGHEVFYIVAPRTYSARPSLELARYAYPHVPVRGDLSGHKAFYDCSKAQRLLSWTHLEA